MGLRILVVDDVRDARETMKLLLEMDGHVVLQAQDGLEAISCAVEARPDIILMDIAMPVMDGLTATKQLQAARETRSIPVVAVSAHMNDPDWRLRALAAGVSAVATKPLDYECLRAILGRVGNT